ncbi:MAG: hypothetical protein FWG46_00990 [Treponema sp.]|nr:hypothetical protein [Treponema sp.]
MRKASRNIFFVVFVIFFSFVVLALGFFLFYGPFFSQTLHWNNNSYKVGIYSVKTEGNKTYININIQRSSWLRADMRGSDSIPPLEMYVMADGQHYSGEILTIEQGRFTFVFNTAVVPDVIFVHIAGQYNLFLTHLSFHGVTRRPIRFYVPPDEAVDLHTLLEQEKLRITVTGISLRYISMTIENISGTTLFIRNILGTSYTSPNDNFQNMALITNCAFIAEAGRVYTLVLPVVCLNQDRQAPGEHVSFTVERFDVYESITQTIRELSILNYSHEEIQSKVWEFIERGER